MESRASRLRLFAEPAAVATSERVRVRIQADTATAGWSGALVIEGATPLEREVRGERCEDVVLALALITVLRLEPNREPDAPAAAPPAAGALAATGATSTTATSATAATAGTSATPTTSATAPSAPSRTASVAPSAATTAAAPASAATAPSVSAAAPAEPAASALEPPSPAPVAAPGAVVGAAGVAMLGPDALRNGALAPQAANAGASQSVASEGAAEAVSGVASPADATNALSDSGSVALSNAAPFLLEPALAAYVGYASAPSHAFQAVLRGDARFAPGRAAWVAAGSLAYGHSGQQNPAGDLGFDSLLAGLSVCPPELTLRLGIWLHACGEARGGALWVAVSARELPLETGSKLRPWFELGPSVQLGLPVSSRWTLRALSSLTLVLMRDSFDVERVVVDEDGQEQSARSTLYRPPLASFQLLIGIGYEL